MVSGSALAPETFEDAAAALRDAAAAGRTVRIVGGATKLHWGAAGGPFDIELSTTGLDAIVAHNAGDMTATLQGGVTLAAAQRAFADAGQMLALDPPLGAGTSGRATIGGIVATGDSGPLAHRYGGPRDLLVGATVALSDGTIAKSGGTVIKNVAGYDIAKLMAGSFGTLGLILSVNVRLHPLPQRTATVTGAASDPRALAAAAHALAAAPAELESLDFSWRNGRGTLLARVAGPRAQPRAQRLVTAMRDAALTGVELVADDDVQLWNAQRAAQRSATGAVVRIAARPSELAAVIGAVAACGDDSGGAATLVGRAALGHSWATVAPDAIARLREKLPAGAAAIVQDRPDDTRRDPWGPLQPAALDLMRRLKLRFDPAGICNPGVFVGGI